MATTLMVAVLTLGLMSCGVPGSTSNSTVRVPVSKPSRWTLSWEDDFQGAKSLGEWNVVTDSGESSLRQLQWNGSSNATIARHGGLVLTASRGSNNELCWYGACQYAGARIETNHRFSQLYGKFEARIELPPGRGIWSAFWLEGADVGAVGWPKCGEVDIVEDNGKSPFAVAGFAHGRHLDSQQYDVVDSPISDGFHTYGIEWTPKGISWIFDGHRYGYLSSYRDWPFDHPFFIILDISVGGRGSYSGPPDSETHFPVRMLVDWVRVYRIAG